MDEPTSVAALLKRLPREMCQGPEEEAEEAFKRPLALNRYCVTPLYVQQETHRNPLYVRESEFADEIHLARMNSESGPAAELEEKIADYYERTII
jgi:hypothetical protein